MCADDGHGTATGRRARIMCAMPSTSRVTLTVVILTVAGACKSHHAPPAAAGADSSATAVAPQSPPTSESGALEGHPLDPHSLSDAELRYGVSPTQSDAVTYQDNVVVME